MILVKVWSLPTLKSNQALRLEWDVDVDRWVSLMLCNRCLVQVVAEVMIGGRVII